MNKKGKLRLTKQDALKLSCSCPIKVSLPPPPAFRIPTPLEEAKAKVKEYQWRYDHVLLDHHKKTLLRKLRLWEKRLEAFMKTISLILLGITLGLILADLAEAEPVYLCKSKTYTYVQGHRYKPCTNFEQKVKREFTRNRLLAFKKLGYRRKEALEAIKTFTCEWKDL